MSDRLKLIRGGLGWLSGKVFHPEGGLALNRLLGDRVTNPKAA